MHRIFSPANKLALAACLCVSMAGCGKSTPVISPPSQGYPTPPTSPAPTDHNSSKSSHQRPLATSVEPDLIEQRLLEIASEYRQYTCVSPHLLQAPALCRVDPGALLQPQLQSSNSKDGATHGKKLYLLYAKDRIDYENMHARVAKGPGQNWENKVGQAVVKQSFERLDIGPSNLVYAEGTGMGDQATSSDKDGLFRRGEAKELFIMLRLPSTTPDTDHGWVYGVVNPDGKSVIQSGAIASCMECHQETTRDRLYGPPSSWPRDAKGKVDWTIKQ